MEQPIDTFIDQFQISIGSYGSTLNFLVSPPTPSAPGTVPQARLVASIRMSMEHLKVMTFMLRDQIKKTETLRGVNITLPVQLLNNLGISPEDWEHVWK